MRADGFTGQPDRRPIKLDQLLLNEVRQLIQRGHEILYSCGWNGRKYAAFKPGGIEVLKFRAQALGVIRQLFGEESGYHCTLQGYAEERRAAEKGYHIKEFLDVMESAYRDCLREQFFEASTSLLAAMSDDLIEMAEAMSNAGCHLPAAERAGAVLDGVLRTLGRARSLPDTEDMSDDELNDALFDMKVYEESSHLRIGACLQIARDVRGGRGACIPEEELAEMVCWVRDFAVEHRLVAAKAARMKH